MRKKFFAPVLALAAGIAAAVERKIMIDTAFESTTGLLRRGDITAVILTVLTALVLVLSWLRGRRAAVKKQVCAEPRDVCRNSSSAVMALEVAAGLLVGVGGVLYAYGAWDVISICFMVLGALSGISMAAISIADYTRKGMSASGLAALVPAVFFAFWLAMYYRDNARDPVILKYCFVCMGLSAFSLSFYFRGGLYYGRRSVTGMVTATLCSVYFAAMMLAEKMGISGLLVAGGMLIYQFLGACRLFEHAEEVKKDEISGNPS